MKPSPRIITAAALAAVLIAGAATAHEIFAPGAVEADGAGHFAYEVTVTITSPIEFAYWYVDGTDNTDLGETYADGFCQVIIEPGVYTTPIEGNLADTGLDGSVYYEHAMCDGWTGAATTVILSPTVGTEAQTWSAVKGLYR